MRFHYINLHAATERRRALEASFHATAPSGLELVRFPAVSTGEASALSGVQSNAAKACFCSHRRLLATQDLDDHIFVLEDDAVLSSAAFCFLPGLLEREDWDLLFTDIAVLDANIMGALHRQRRGFSGDIALLNLRQVPFAGASAYAVNARSRDRLNELLAHEPLDLPYDLALRRMIERGQLRGICAFPFVTTISDDAFESQIQGKAYALRDMTLNLFRRLMYVERDLQACLDIARRLDGMADDEARIAGTIFAGAVSTAFAGGGEPP